MKLDYFKHIIAGFLLSALTAFVIHIWSYKLMILSAVVAFGVGVAKELIWDKWLKKGTPEWQDAFATLYGGLFASIIAYLIWYF